MYTINTLENHLKKFNCMQGLEEIGKLSNQLYSSGETFENMPIKIGELTHRQTISQWGLSFLAYKLIMISNDGKRSLLDWQNLVKAHGIFGELEVPLSTDEEKISFLLRTSQEQFWWQEFDMPTVWTRYIEIYDHDSFFSDSFYELTGLSLEEYFKLGLIFSVFINKGNNITLNITDLMNLEYPIQTNHLLTQEKVDKFLKLTSGDYNTIRTESQMVNSITLPKYERYEFNPLQKYPIVLGDKRFSYYKAYQYVLPNIMLLLRKIAQGSYWDLREHFMKQKSFDFLTKFGESFESYCGSTLSRYFGDNNVLRVKDVLGSASDNKSHSDWLVIEDENIYIFECKSSLLPIIARRTFLPSVVSRWIERNLLHAIDQLNITEKELNEVGYVGNKKIFKFILLLEELHIADESYIKQTLLEKYINIDDATYNDIHIIRIFELEKMEQIIKKYSFAEILEKKNELQKTDGGNFLNASNSLDNSTPLTSEYLKAKFDEILSSWSKRT